MDNIITNPVIKERLNILTKKIFFEIINVSDLDYYVKKFTVYHFLQLFIIA